MPVDPDRPIFSISDIEKVIGEPPKWRPGDDGKRADEWKRWSANTALLDTLLGKIANEENRAKPAQPPQTIAPLASL